jgi:hypothetical protein
VPVWSETLAETVRRESSALRTGRDNKAYLHCTPPGPIPYLRDRALVLGARPEADEQEDYGLPQHLAMDRTFIWVAELVPKSFQRLHYGTDISTLRSLN